MIGLFARYFQKLPKKSRAIVLTCLYGVVAGVVAVVDAVGRIRGGTPLFEEAVAVDDVVIADTFSLYRTLGDWFVYLCMIAVAALAALRMRLGSVLIRERERGILPSR